MIYYFYKIVCDDKPDYSYVGSTRAFDNRKYTHKSNCNNENSKMYNLKLYQIIRENDGWDNWRMVCIHQGEYPDKRSAEIKEEQLRVELNANMNSQKCYTTEDQKKQYQKEYHKEYDKEYREQNNDQINVRQNKKFECECDGKYTYTNKSRHLKSKIHQKYLKENVNK